MKEGNLARAQDIARELEEARISLKYAMLDSTVGVSMWFNGKGSASVPGTKIKKHTQVATKAA